MWIYFAPRWIGKDFFNSFVVRVYDLPGPEYQWNKNASFFKTHFFLENGI